MKELLKNTLILLVITVIAGFVLGYVYENTKDTIALRAEEETKAAYREVFADAQAFDDALLATDNFASEGYGDVKIDKLLIASDNAGNNLGYIFIITSKEGYGGDIRFAMGVRNDGTLNGISILDISETAGLGMEAEKVLKPQFAGKNVEQFTFTKTGAETDDQIDAISGATITTKAFTNGVNLGLHYFSKYLGGANHE